MIKAATTEIEVSEELLISPEKETGDAAQYQEPKMQLEEPIMRIPASPAIEEPIIAAATSPVNQ